MLTPLEEVLSLVSVAALALLGKPLLQAAFGSIFSRKPPTATATGTVTTTATGTTVNVNTKTPSTAPDSPSPAQLDKEQTRRAARAAGFDPGRTAEFARMNSLGPMRCDGHPALVLGQEAILVEVREARKETNRKLDTISQQISKDGREAAKLEARLDSAEKDIERHEERLNER